MARKTILFIALSLDGYIAQQGDDLTFLSLVQKEGEDYGYTKFMETIDTVIMGRRTYDWVMRQLNAYPHAEIESYIITKTPRPSNGKVHFHTGALPELIKSLKSKEGKHIFIDGGAQLVHHLLKDKLIDELVLSFIPVMLGNGIRLFQDERPMQQLKLIESKSFDTGLVQVRYEVLTS